MSCYKKGSLCRGHGKNFGIKLWFQLPFFCVGDIFGYFSKKKARPTKNTQKKHQHLPPTICFTILLLGMAIPPLIGNMMGIYTPTIRLTTIPTIGNHPGLINPAAFFLLLAFQRFRMLLHLANAKANDSCLWGGVCDDFI